MRLDNTYNGGELTCQVAWLLDSFSINLIYKCLAHKKNTHTLYSSFLRFISAPWSLRPQLGVTQCLEASSSLSWVASSLAWLKGWVSLGLLIHVPTCGLFMYCGPSYSLAASHGGSGLQRQAFQQTRWGLHGLSWTSLGCHIASSLLQYSLGYKFIKSPLGGLFSFFFIRNFMTTFSKHHTLWLSHSIPEYYSSRYTGNNSCIKSTASWLGPFSSSISIP